LFSARAPAWARGAREAASPGSSLTHPLFASQSFSVTNAPAHDCNAPSLSLSLSPDDYPVYWVVPPPSRLLIPGMRLMSIFAANLRILRSERNLRQDELADLAGLNRNTVGNLEREDYCATLDTVEALAAALNVPPTRLLRPLDSVRPPLA
jgi:DNA-binding XRE family transcriptional regulator